MSNPTAQTTEKRASLEHAEHRELLEERIRRVVEAAPPLSDQQRLALTVLLGGA